MEEKILNFINKAQYKIGELGFKQVDKSSRSIRRDDKDFVLMLELSHFCAYLYETLLTIEKEGASYYNFVQAVESDVIKQIEMYEIKAKLNTVPSLTYTKNSTTFVKFVTIQGGTTGVQLPDGGGVNFFLTKTASGALVWEELGILESNFDEL